MEAHASAVSSDEPNQAQACGLAVSSESGVEKPSPGLIYRKSRCSSP